jgi:hypothetical protein
MLVGGWVDEHDDATFVFRSFVNAPKQDVEKVEALLVLQFID